MTIRWQPNRAGLLNVWRYHDETLTFADGRLLLRGPNGSGKSKALELLLPFLLDANLRPSRLSTFGSGDRSMHWNLMGQGTVGATRVGYVWLELRRPADLGEQHVTIGARLQASKSDTRVRTTYFVVDARVGYDLELQPDREPLTVAHLKTAVNSRGKVYEDDVHGYREHVRTTLFPGMEPDRYDALVQALLQLRRPKLSERLDPENLSTFLSSALPPVDATRIEELAEGFERLDQRRAELADLAVEVRAARTLLDTTRTYGAVLLRERARSVTAAATEVDNASRRLRQGGDRLTDAQEREAELTRLQAEAETRLTGRQAEQQALKDSDAYQEGRNLEDLREKAAQSTKVANRSRHDLETAQARAVRAATKAAEAVRAAADQSGAAERARAAAVQTARAIGMEDLIGTDDLAARIRIVEGHVSEVLRLLDRLEKAGADRDAAEAARTRARELLAQAASDLADARAAASAEEERYVEEVMAWARSCSVLELDEPALLAALDTDRVTEHVQQARYETRRVLERARDEQARLHDAEAGDRDRLTAERAALADQSLVAPAPSRFRSQFPRRGPGARLWQVVDFQDSVPGDDQAGLEAALESSGLLDAWLASDGSLIPAGHDTVLAPSAPVDGPRLSQVLRPDVPAGVAVSATAVTRALDAVGLHQAGGEASEGTAASWVSPAGAWRLGVARGVWSKDAAQFIGAAARERHRLVRLAELDEQITEHARSAAGHADTVQRLEEQLRIVDAEAARLPSDAALAAARRAIDEVSVLQAERERADGVAAEAVRAAQDAVAHAHETLVRGAQERALPNEREQLETITATLALLRAQDRDRVQAERDAEAARATSLDTQEAAEVAADDASSKQDRAEEDGRTAHEDAIRLRTLEERLGGSYAEVVSRLDELTGQIDDEGHEVKRLTSEAGNAGKAVARLEQADLTAESEHQSALEHRDEVSRALVAALSTTLAADTGIAEPLPEDAGVTAVLEEARRLDRTLPTTRPNDTLLHAQNRLHQRAHEIGDKLARRAHLDVIQESDVVIPVAVLPGRRIGIAELLHLVEEEERRAHHEITDSEHALFEKALTGDTRRHLSQTIRDADALVRRMNDRLGTVRTASGVQVRLKWDVRDEAGTELRSARDLLLRNPALLAEAEHDALHTFFRNRIDAAHAQDSGRSWAQQLATVFDYTQWHRFQVQLSRPDIDGWRTLTKRTHSVLSGGEKAIALHLPLFAALAAHYEATPTAPRLILLDEVFVGIDEINRGQIFALLRDLDLDLVLTSDHEWACYPEVPEIAIHALAAGSDGDPVTTTRFVWRGGRLVQDDDLPDALADLMEQTL